MSELTAQQAAELTDAMARGRLCLAEVTGIREEEMQAMFELAARRLEGGAPQEAAQILAALVMLFAFSPTYWRAYGIALHRQGLLPQAAAAYRASLILAPGHGLTECYLGEALLPDDAAAAAQHLQAAALGGDARASGRAQILLTALQPAPEPPPSPAPAPSTEPTQPAFALPDGRALPLLHSRFDEADARHPQTPGGEAVTARILVAGAREVTATNTAVVARGPRPTPLREDSQASITAHLPREAPPGAQATAWWKRRRQVSLTEETDVLDKERKL